MPVLSGGSLSDRLARPVDDATAVAWLRTLAAALDYAHGKGIVHRDVKPLNVLFDEGGAPHLSDFGLAKGLDEATQLTQTGMILGTPLYMSPEQAMGTAAGPAADQYSLGIVAYRLLAGRLPYEKEPTPVLLRRTAFEEMPPPSQIRPGLPPAVDSVFSRVLAKTAEGRFPSCTAFVEALARALRARGDPPAARLEPDATKPEPVRSILEAGSAPPPRPTTERRTPPPLPPSPPAETRRRRIPAGLVLLGGLFTVLLGVSLWIVLRPGSRTAALPPPAATPAATLGAPSPAPTSTPLPVETPFGIAVPIERATVPPRPTSARTPSPVPSPTPIPPPPPTRAPTTTSLPSPTAVPRTWPVLPASPTMAPLTVWEPARPSPATQQPAAAADPLAAIPRRPYREDLRLKDAWLEVKKAGSTLCFQFTKSLEGNGENIGYFGTLSVTTRGNAPLVPGARSPLPLLCKGLDSRKVTCAVPPPADPYAHLAVRLGEGDRVSVRAVLSGFSFSATLRVED